MRSWLPRGLLALCLLGVAAAQCWHDDRIVQKGELLPYPQDNCFNRVCRCESWDRCRLEVERKAVLLKVKETTRVRQTTGTAATEARVKTLTCKCVEDLQGSHEMNFFCAAPHQLGRSVGANLIGCLDLNGELAHPGQRVKLQTSRGENMDCDCDARGHYVNCVGEHEVRDGCRDSNGRLVALGALYTRTVRLPSRTVHLECTCTKSDLETSCSVV